MELIRGRHNIRTAHRGCVVTIGNFDGVHRGHRSLIAELTQLARRHAVPAMVIVFEPQASEYFYGAEAPARLTRLREKYVLLQALGVDRLLVLHFNGQLARFPAEAFIRELLVAQLGIRALVIGDNFKFGQGRRGDIHMLRAFAADHPFGLVQADVVSDNALRVSSTRIRELLRTGSLHEAAALLGRPFAIGGRVIRGQQRGRTIGYPTINIDLHRNRSPLHGIFAVRVHGLRTQPLLGAAYIGRRPTVADNRELLEVHLFDFDNDCYGRFVAVEFVTKIRDDMKFESIEALRRQIDADANAARRVLGEPVSI